MRIAERPRWKGRGEPSLQDHHVVAKICHILLLSDDGHECVDVQVHGYEHSHV